MSGPSLLPRRARLLPGGCLALAAVLVLGGCDSFGHIQKPPPISAPGAMADIPSLTGSDDPIEVSTRPRTPAPARR
ncbi:hypothetical protein [Teichococcus aestuarii]|uniref:hypothetical protein n=1 Tax=Teichococcus aestuarii TaxID=568898 RepID=UPI00361BDB9A